VAQRLATASDINEGARMFLRVMMVLKSKRQGAKKSGLKNQ
jgi:hypothetical protein